MKQKMLIEERIIAVILCLMVLMVSAQVLSRYLLHTSLSYTEEVVRYCFVWITFLGASAATFRKKHLSIAGALNIVPSRCIKWVTLLTGIAAVLFTGLLTVFGIVVVLLQHTTKQTTAALGFPMWIIGLAVQVCSLVMMLRIIMYAFSKERHE